MGQPWEWLAMCLPLPTDIQRTNSKGLKHTKMSKNNKNQLSVS
jgi:hypothetical protein